MQKKFDVAAQSINANPHFRFEFKGLVVQEKFNKMVKGFNKEDSNDRKRSGAGRDMNIKDELLSGIIEAIDGMR